MEKELINNSQSNIYPFHMPGHKRRGSDIGEGLDPYAIDITEIDNFDNLHHAEGIIKEAQAAAAALYGAKRAYFLINGSTCGILTAVSAVCRWGDTIVMARNCHKSAINALVLSGAKPIFIKPDYDYNLEIANQPSIEAYIKAMDENPKAKAIFVINPTYFGAVLDLRRLVVEAHSRHMIVLVDEAHGAHFGFNQYGPLSAMECKADVSAISLHKTGGSLTQSSALLRQGDLVSHYELSKALATINTTSPSTLLLASLDASRKYMALNGQVVMNDIIALANYARKEINRIPGFKAHGRDYFLAKGVYDYDDTKLVIELSHINLNGFECYNLLKDEYNIQMELAEAYTLLAIIAIGSLKEHVDNLINALKDISKRYLKNDDLYPKFKYDSPFAVGIIRPRTAYHAPLKVVDLDDALGLISKESIMIYPPGIPLIIPGEIFNEDVIARIKYYKSKNATVLSDYPDKVSVIDFKTWDLYDKHKKDLEEYYESIKRHE